MFAVPVELIANVPAVSSDVGSAAVAKVPEPLADLKLAKEVFALLVHETLQVFAKVLLKDPTVAAVGNGVVFETDIPLIVGAAVKVTEPEADVSVDSCAAVALAVEARVVESPV
jgi:hypothetical protein